jgi:hypothetical protein
MMGGSDPIKSGLVASLSRPGGNITGMTFIIGELEGKRLDVLLQLAPQATTVGYMVGHRSDNDETVQGLGELLKAAQTLGRQIIVQECRQVSDLENAFATMIERQAGAVVVRAFPLAFNRGPGPGEKALSAASQSNPTPATAAAFGLGKQGGKSPGRDDIIAGRRPVICRPMRPQIAVIARAAAMEGYCGPMWF